MTKFQFLFEIWLLALTIVLGGYSVSASTITFKHGPCVGVSQITCPSSKQILFNLFTKEKPNGQLLNFLDARTWSIFNSTHPTKILIHGFNSDSKASAMMDMVKAYFVLGPHNVITADWSSFGTGPEYCLPLASKNTEFVGQCVADLVNKLRNKTEDIHVIGHSLGARVAGYAANFLKPYVLPRITGLDPAKPMFRKSDLIHKLDSTDAAFVDIIHTNMLNKGKVETAGHVDFYVNGGNSQPGCDKKSMFGLSSVCSHLRAVEYFIESIKSPMGFWGWSCPSLSSVISGSCTINSPAIIMGEPVSHRARGVVHVETGPKAPFSLGPWLLGGQSPYDVERPVEFTWDRDHHHEDEYYPDHENHPHHSHYPHHPHYPHHSHYPHYSRDPHYSQYPYRPEVIIIN